METNETHQINPKSFEGVVNDRPHNSIFIGRKGSGKSTLLVELLCSKTAWYKRYSKVVIVSSTFEHQYDTLWKRIHKQGVVVYDKLNDALLEHLMLDCKQNNHSMLVIMDDMSTQIRKNVDQNLVDKMVSTSRHIGKGMSFVWLQQQLTQLSTSIRTNADCYVIFGAVSYREMDMIYGEMSVVDRKTFMKIFRSATQAQYNFLAITNHGGKLRFWDSFKKEIPIDWTL